MVRRLVRLAIGLAVIALWPAGAAEAASVSVARADEASRVVEVAGTVEVRAGADPVWRLASPGIEVRPGDRVRTGAGSRAAVLFSDRSVLRLGERSTLEIQPPRAAEKRRFGLLEGILFFFNRERPADVEFETPIVAGAIRGTEFVLGAGGAVGATRLALFDGRVQLTAAGVAVALGPGEQAVVEPGRAPVASPLLEGISTLQWALYYPAVVVPGDLGLTEDDRVALGEALVAYEAGDLLAARAAVVGVPEGGPGRELFRAALDLSVGLVDSAEARLSGLGSGLGSGSGSGAGVELPVARALRELLTVVRGNTESGRPTAVEPGTASEWLARSYTEQAAFRLEAALAAARRAVGLAPESGFAQVRVAELWLGFDRRREAFAALERALAVAPRLAPARALQGFVWLDRGDPRRALAAFEEALAVDAALGSAWLGKGLSEMRLRRSEEALRSLETAAALDPRRALHRAYLGKGFSERGESSLAGKEFRLARELDPADPTAWFYSALHEWQENRPNAALRDLERSVELNGQRQLFRSRLALDRDLAVRHANLAGIYRDAGLPEAGLRSAAEAVADDYANHSGHLFLAHSYQALEDPNRFDLRYETVRQSELLVANLLAPAGGANLSQWVSQQEHLRFFDPPPIGAATFTEYRDPGGWRQKASVFGAVDGFGYALDADLAWADGPADNDERERRDVSLQVKQRVTGRDEAYLQVAFVDAEAGDVARHEDPQATRPGFHVEEQQIPNVYLGWHRAWSPESHTLLLVSRLTDGLRLEDPAPDVLFLRQSAGTVTSVSTPPLFDLRYESRFTLYSAEWQQVWQHETHTVVAGVRGQAGEVDPEAVLGRPLAGAVTDQRFDEPLRRVNAYVYEHWQILERLQLIAGLGYDRLEHPLNTEVAPLTEGTETREQFGPRAGLLATPWRDGRLRAAYSRSLGGQYFDDSVRLEPAQVAGFPQAFRSLLPESVGGLVPGTTFDAVAAGYDQRIGSLVHLGVEAGLARSEGDRVVGVLTNSLPLPVPDAPSRTWQEPGYVERTLAAYAVASLGDGWTLGLRYRVGDAAYTVEYPGIAPGTPGLARLEEDVESVLQQGLASIGYVHASGVFAEWQTLWFHQETSGYTPERGAEDFWQHQAWVGYRWPRRRAELRVGVLNLTDVGYRLNPLNTVPLPPQERTAVVTLRLNF